MAKVVPLGAYAAARDRTLLLEILQLAQLLQALGRFDRRGFLESRRDQELVAKRLARIRELAGKVSAKAKRGIPEVPWEAIASGGGGADPAELWTALKKVVPRLVTGLAPLAAGTEMSAFTLAPPPKKARSPKPSSRRRR